MTFNIIELLLVFIIIIVVVVCCWEEEEEEKQEEARTSSSSSAISNTTPTLLSKSQQKADIPMAPRTRARRYKSKSKSPGRPKAVAKKAPSTTRAKTPRRTTKARERSTTKARESSTTKARERSTTSDVIVQDMNERLAGNDEVVSPKKAMVAFSSSPFLYHAALLVFLVLALFSPLLQPTSRGSYGGMHTDPPLRRVDGLDGEASGLLVAKLKIICSRVGQSDDVAERPGSDALLQAESDTERFKQGNVGPRVKGKSLGGQLHEGLVTHVESGSGAGDFDQGRVRPPSESECHRVQRVGTLSAKASKIEASQAL